MSSEKKIEARLVREVEALGGECLKLEVAGRRGWPDRLCILPGGHVVFVELKTDTGRASAQQQHIRNRLKRLEHPAFIARGDSGVDVVLEFMRRLLD